MLIKRVTSFLCFIFIGCKSDKQEFEIDIKINQLIIERLYDIDSYCKIDNSHEISKVNSILNEALVTSVLFQGDLRLIINGGGKKEVLIVSEDNFLKYGRKTYKLPSKSFRVIETYYLKCKG